MAFHTKLRAAKLSHLTFREQKESSFSEFVAACPLAEVGLLDPVLVAH
jgi:hypothetical protein